MTQKKIYIYFPNFFFYIFSFYFRSGLKKKCEQKKKAANRSEEKKGEFFFSNKIKIKKLDEILNFFCYKKIDKDSQCFFFDIFL